MSGISLQPSLSSPVVLAHHCSPLRLHCARSPLIPQRTTTEERHQQGQGPRRRLKREEGSSGMRIRCLGLLVALPRLLACVLAKRPTGPRTTLAPGMQPGTREPGRMSAGGSERRATRRDDERGGKRSKRTDSRKSEDRTEAQRCGHQRCGHQRRDVKKRNRYTQATGDDSL